MKIALFRHAAMAASLGGALVSAGMLAAPAQAQFGGIVYDPSNYAQNVMTAARSLEQINNQIRQIQNQATSLINEARNLTSLPISTIQTLQRQVDQTRQLLGEAQRIAYDVTDVQQVFNERYKGAALSAGQARMVSNADARWQDSVGAFEDAMKVQAGIVGNLGATRSSVTTLINASQSATGALQAAGCTGRQPAAGAPDPAARRPYRSHRRPGARPVARSGTQCGDRGRRPCALQALPDPPLR